MRRRPAAARPAWVGALRPRSLASESQSVDDADVRGLVRGGFCDGSGCEGGGVGCGVAAFCSGNSTPKSDAKESQ